MITSFFKPKRDRASADGNDIGINKKNDTKNKKQKSSHCKTNKSKEISRLITHLNDSSPNFISWKVSLDKHFSSPSFGRLASFVESERGKYTIYPPVEETFAALNLCSLSNTKLVIVGQDPYHGPQQAHGLCFSVRKDVKIPPSLRNIYKELLNDSKITNFTHMPNHGNLERWSNQGVLMINNVLTVRKGEAHSHKKRGWEEFTDAIIRAVDQRKPIEGDTGNGNNNKNGVVFLLWGKPATLKTQTALTGALSSSSRHKVICTSHPSPLGATKTDSPFSGSKCFSRANEALRELGYDEIDWVVDGKLP
mmetsp:Transcript_38726/g.39103  ORF Transcript_38726/g.39103 Transcript_38726/m.39103 type:complete len:308 (-) Transcript_38726:2002-2925(-)